VPLFDDWAEYYDAWFETPIGALVREYEAAVVQDLLRPQAGEIILDAGCGTGVFTLDLLQAGAQVTGLDISGPMLAAAEKKLRGYPFRAVTGDMLALPFPDGIFDKAVSITALEFIEDGKKAVTELFRVTKPGGRIVVATLNSLSPWASRRQAKQDEHLLVEAHYRSTDDLLALGPVPGRVVTAVHFNQDDAPSVAREKERTGQAMGLLTGAFAAIAWNKPAD
jgi:ubiquinone/menaquinone biosynthesis C-methylase UbiE